MKRKLSVLFVIAALGVAVTLSLAVEFGWDDIKRLPMPIAGHEWSKNSEVQKARYLERFYSAIQYLTANIGKSTKELALSETGPYIANSSRVTLEVISAYYRFYGDFAKAAEVLYEFWADSGGANFTYPDEDPLTSVIFSFEEAGMYKETLPLYRKKHQERLETIKAQSDIELFQKDFNEYRKQYPDLAEIYMSFVESWEQAKKLANTSKPKPLDPAVQHHKWFYSDKTEEVLKALAYYSKHKVKFMVEKAAKDKRPIIAKKAKEYLDNWAVPVEKPSKEVSVQPEEKKAAGVNP